MYLNILFTPISLAILLLAIIITIQEYNLKPYFFESGIIPFFVISGCILIALFYIGNALYEICFYYCSARKEDDRSNININNTKLFSSNWLGFLSNTQGIPIEPGAVGLHNLGNSCYMNSSLQALVTVNEVTHIFYLVNMKNI